MIYGSATPTKADVDQACRATRLAARLIGRRLSGVSATSVVGHSGIFRSPSSDTAPPEAVERTTLDPHVTRGALAASFRCFVPGRVTVAMTNSKEACS